MGRFKEPVNVLLAKGKTHLTKKEVEFRMKSELKVPFKDIQAPDYLDEKQKREFMEYAGKLEALDIFTELDVDTLARYILAKDLYLSYTKAIVELIKKNDLVLLKDIQNMQDKAFKQAHTCATSLCLTITSRCKIVIPVPPESDDDEL